MFSREITKRSLKNFTAEKWRETLATKDWDSIINCDNLDKKSGTVQQGHTRNIG